MTPPDAKQSLADIRADMHRRLALEAKPASIWNQLMTLPKRGVLSVLIYRINRYLYFKNNLVTIVMIRLLKYLEFHYCHNELDPRAVIGPGLVLSDQGGVGLGFNVIIGKNCTFMGRATPTLGAMEGIDIERDRICIGDYCTFGHNARVINPVTIADGVQIAANSVLMTSVKVTGTVMAGFPAKKIALIPLEQVQTWSPLLSRHVSS